MIRQLGPLKGGVLAALASNDREEAQSPASAFPRAT